VFFRPNRAKAAALGLLYVGATLKRFGQAADRPGSPPGEPKQV